MRLGGRYPTYLPVPCATLAHPTKLYRHFLPSLPPVTSTFSFVTTFASSPHSPWHTYAIFPSLRCSLVFSSTRLLYPYFSTPVRLYLNVALLPWTQRLTIAVLEYLSRFSDCCCGFVYSDDKRVAANSGRRLTDNISQRDAVVNRDDISALRAAASALTTSPFSPPHIATVTRATSRLTGGRQRDCYCCGINAGDCTKRAASS